jgi:hypothetical protein
MNRRKPIIALTTAAGVSALGCAARSAAQVASAPVVAASPAAAAASSASARAQSSASAAGAPGSSAAQAAQAVRCPIPTSMTVAQMQSFFPDPSRKPPKRDWLEFVELVWTVAHEGPFDSPKAVLERLKVVPAGAFLPEYFSHISAEEAQRSRGPNNPYPYGHAQIRVPVDIGDSLFIDWKPVRRDAPKAEVFVAFAVDSVGLSVDIDSRGHDEVTRLSMADFLKIRRPPDRTRTSPPPTVHEISLRPPWVDWVIRSDLEITAGFSAVFTNYRLQIEVPTLKSISFSTSFKTYRSYPCLY